MLWLFFVTVNVLNTFVLAKSRNLVTQFDLKRI